MAATMTLRTDELRQILESQRDRILATIRAQMRGEREAGATHEHEVEDEHERAEADVQSDIELALLQMQTETLQRVEAALKRLDRGEYGLCAECDAEISAARLKALPFAIRCRDCEESHEAAASRRHAPMAWQSSFSALNDVR